MKQEINSALLCKSKMWSNRPKKYWEGNKNLKKGGGNKINFVQEYTPLVDNNDNINFHSKLFTIFDNYDNNETDIENDKNNHKTILKIMRTTLIHNDDNAYE